MFAAVLYVFSYVLRTKYNLTLFPDMIYLYCQESGDYIFSLIGNEQTIRIDSYIVLGENDIITKNNRIWQVYYLIVLKINA